MTGKSIVFIHLLDQQGQLIAQYDGMALDGQWPTTCWQEGRPFADTYELHPPASTPAGIYKAQIGLYWLPSGERIPLSQPNDRLSHTVEAGTIRLQDGR